MEALTYESDETILQRLSSLRYSARIFKSVFLSSAYFSVPLHSSPIIWVFLLFTISTQLFISKTIFLKGQESICQGSAKPVDYCCRFVVSGPALDVLQQNSELIHLISQLTAPTPYPPSFYFMACTRNLSSHPIPRVTRFPLQVFYQDHSLLNAL